jgi:hypothetical protein
MLEEVATGVLVDVVVSVAKQVGRAANWLGGRRYQRDLEIAKWFDTYRLDVIPVEALELSDEVTAEALAELMHGNEFHAVIQELLAARLTDAPEAQAINIRTSLGLVVAAKFPATDTAAIADILYDYYNHEVCAIVARLEGYDPDILQQLRTKAFSTRIVATLQAIERHLAALSGMSRLEVETDYISRYRRHVSEHHGRLQPPDFERRRLIPIEKIYVPPSIISLSEGDSGMGSQEIDLRQLDREVDRTVLLGDPGGGKTTAANVLMYSHAIDSGSSVPFLVTLKDFAAKNPPERSVLGYIEYRLETFYQCPPPPGTIPRLFLSGQACVIFDGLDELVDTFRRAEVTAIVEHFCTEYPLTSVLVTSRVIGYDEARLDDSQFDRYRIGGFYESHVVEYVRKWFAQETELEGAEVERWAYSFMSESSNVPDLRSNPLMLALMCILYRGEGSIPQNRSEVYEQCANLLFRKWDARREIHVELRARHLVEPALRHLAYWLLTRDEARSAVTERELVAETATFLYGRGFETIEESMEAAREFISFCRGRMWVFSDTGTTARGETVFTFTHRTFLEYFAAYHLAINHDTPERLARFLAPHVAKQEWEVVNELAIQIKDRSSDRAPERIFKVLLAQSRRRTTHARGNILLFLVRCLGLIDPPPRIVRELVRSVLDHFLDGPSDRSVFFAPLGALTENCTNCRDLVRDEISIRVIPMLQSVDPVVQARGVQLVAWFWAGSDSPSHSWNTSTREFWYSFMQDTFRSFPSLLDELVLRDAGIRVLALASNLLSMDQVLMMEDGFSSLLRDNSIQIYGITYVPYLPYILGGYTRGGAVCLYGSHRHRDASQDFDSIGRYILGKSGGLPWVVDPVKTSMTDFVPGHDESTPSEFGPISETEYLGAVVTLFILAEVDIDKYPPKGASRTLGPLHMAYQYMLCRWAPESDRYELPDLPVPKQIRPILKDWANNLVDFVQFTGSGRIFASGRRN